jgi:hypothetical protein
VQTFIMLITPDDRYLARLLSLSALHREAARKPAA